MAKKKPTPPVTISTEVVAELASVLSVESVVATEVSVEPAEGTQVADFVAEKPAIEAPKAEAAKAEPVVEEFDPILSRNCTRFG